MGDSTRPPVHRDRRAALIKTSSAEVKMLHKGVARTSRRQNEEETQGRKNGLSDPRAAEYLEVPAGSKTTGDQTSAADSTIEDTSDIISDTPISTTTYIPTDEKPPEHE